MLKKILESDSSHTTIIIRIMVGAIFLSEGIQKFLFPELLGSGRFEKIGIPNPHFLSPFVGIFEIVCGTSVLLGFFTRVAAIPLLIIMLVAIFTTKAKLISDNGIWSINFWVVSEAIFPLLTRSRILVDHKPKINLSCSVYSES